MQPSRILRVALIIVLSILFLLLQRHAITTASSTEAVLVETFGSIDEWEQQLFPRIKEVSSYTLEKAGSENYLRAESSASASGLRWKGEFDPYRYPVLRWRWKVTRIYEKGNALTKSGDDYPIRLYVMFKYDPGDPAVKKSLKYSLAKLLYGKYPPHSSLDYIWANREYSDEFIPNAYTRKSMMIPIQMGSKDVGKWITNEVNVIDDYRRAFGANPPGKASIAVMNDSDNTGEESVSYIDFIEILRYLND